MKKNFIVAILTIITCLFLVGCGKGSDINSTPNGNQTNDNTNINNDTSNTTIVEDDEIIDIDEEDNGPIDNGIVVVKEVINCDGCVYAYFSDEGDKAKTLGATLSPSDYTNDINNLKTAGGKQRHNFFGLVLSDNTISRADACILKENKIYCI